jgi:hypothetical protein
VIHPDGIIWMVEVMRGSGLSVPDPAVALFRNAHLPPADVMVTPRYRPVDGGG